VEELLATAATAMGGGCEWRKIDASRDVEAIHKELEDIVTETMATAQHSKDFGNNNYLCVVMLHLRATHHTLYTISMLVERLKPFIKTMGYGSTHKAIKKYLCVVIYPRVTQ
jgi:hypothetical protein